MKQKLSLPYFIFIYIYIYTHIVDIWGVYRNMYLNVAILSEANRTIQATLGSRCALKI